MMFYLNPSAMKTKILILDDERLSRLYIRDLIEEFSNDAIIHEAETAGEALDILKNEEIEIFFSDIHMPSLNGFDLLQKLPERNFDLIFTTAYAQYAIQAIKEGASDYLLKPIKKIEFKEAFLKALKRISATNRLDTSNDLLSKIPVSHLHGIKYVELRAIVYLEANNTYTTIVLDNDDKVVVSKPMIRFENNLPEKYFFRIHKSYIVNVIHFTEYRSKDGDIALMDNGVQLHISRYRLEGFLSHIAKVFGDIRI
jgi:two-component system, LytTR family, response regulator